MICRGWVRDHVTARNAAPAVSFEVEPFADLFPSADPPSRHRIRGYESRADYPHYGIRDELHACAATAVAAAIELSPQPLRLKPSIGFLYYAGRYLQMREWENDGASIYATLRASQVIGFCDEATFATTDNWDAPPAPEVYAAAEEQGVVNFYRLEREHLKRVISSDYPVLFGAYVERDYFRPDRFEIEPPHNRLIDRHCMLAVGYEDDGDDQDRGWFLVADPVHGEDFVKISYDYVSNATLTDDFWVVADVGQKGERALDQVRKDYVDVAARFREIALEAYDSVRPPRRKRSESPPVAANIDDKIAGRPGDAGR